MKNFTNSALNNRCLLSISKFWPEYSGPGVRMVNLYKYLHSKNQFLQVDDLNSSFYLNKNSDFKSSVFKLKRFYRFRFKNKYFIYLFNLKDFILSSLFIFIFKNNYINFHIVGESAHNAGVIFALNILKKPYLYEMVTLNSTVRQYIIPHLYVGASERAIIIAISNYIYNNIPSKYAKNFIWNRPNPVNTDLFTEISASEKIKFKRTKLLPEKSKLICFIGKFMPSKNQFQILRAFSLLDSSFSLILAGPLNTNYFYGNRDKMYFEKILSFIDQKNLSKRVKIINNFVESSQILPFCDIYISLSSYEGLGTTVLEALSSNIPVVVNNCVEPYKQWVKDGVNGFFTSTDSTSVANFIKKATMLDKNMMNSENSNIRSSVNHKKIHDKYISYLSKHEYKKQI